MDGTSLNHSADLFLLVPNGAPTRTRQGAQNQWQSTRSPAATPSSYEAPKRPGPVAAGLCHQPGLEHVQPAGWTPHSQGQGQGLADRNPR